MKVVPKASDYSGVLEGLINAAVRRLTVKLYTINAFPANTTTKEWAQECWILTCRAARKKFAPADANTRIVTAISKRVSSVRSHLRDTVRSAVPRAYNLDDKVADDGVADANKVQVLRLLRGAPKLFGYKDHESDTPAVFAEVPILMSSLQQELFSSPTDIGPEFADMFDPMPIPVLALLLTCVEYGLDSWSAGRLDSSHAFRTSDYRSKYDAHRGWLVKDWEAMAPDIVKAIRHEMYEQVLRYGNITIQSRHQPEKVSDATRERMRAALAARYPPRA
ncbi:hypothetical protein PsYK624_066570 [Phanerochaete sordida]|uniref:DUF6532 domain-containing protein n=1 Tax=Phanerochaete sordida TaxID=48140 RepID=A0A9P3G745_9APHY|nr:hypothetical protein PsYK624_066570 [Phanerochaete sordida]